MMKVAMMVWKERFCQKWLVREFILTPDLSSESKTHGQGPRARRLKFSSIAHLLILHVYLYCNSSALSVFALLFTPLLRSRSVF